MGPLVSVIIPTHDRLAFLREAVASALAQTAGRLEVIVVDDASTDGTWSWLGRQGGRVRRLRCRRQRGPAAARNRGAAAARAPLLAFLDSDDLFLPGKLEAQLERALAPGAPPLWHTDEVWLKDGKPVRQRAKHEKRGGQIFEHCLPMCRISPSAAVLRRDVFLAEGGFDEELEVAEDYELWLRLTRHRPVGFIPEPLVVKRGGHADQLSMKYGQIEKFRIEALRRLLLRTPLSPPQREAALATLRAKCGVYARGCRKRGRLDEAEEVLALPGRLAGSSGPDPTARSGA